MFRDAGGCGFFLGVNLFFLTTCLVFLWFIWSCTNEFEHEAQRRDYSADAAPIDYG